MKLTYPDGTIVEAYAYPWYFTGIIENRDGKHYVVDDELHRDGGLPAFINKNGKKEYWVRDKLTGRFVP